MSDLGESPSKTTDRPALDHLRVRSSVDVAGLLAEIDQQPEAWHLQRDGRPAWRDSQQVVLASVYRDFFPECAAFAQQVAAEAGGKLTRATLVRIYPRSRIYAHEPEGGAESTKKRFILILRGTASFGTASDPGSMTPGELWLVPGATARDLCNDAAEWATLLLVDVGLRTPGPASRPPRLPIREAWSGDAETVRALERVKVGIVAKGIFEATDEDRIISRTGGTFRRMFDLRAVLLDASLLEAICSLFWDRFESALPFQIVGMEVAGVPLVIGLLAAARARGLTVNGVIVRKERKTYFRGQAIEGTLDSSPIFLVDDSLHSGASADKARVTLEQAGHEVDFFFCVVDFEANSGRRWLAAHGIDGHALFCRADFAAPAEAPTADLPSRTFLPAWRHRPATGHPFHVVPKSAPLYVDGRIFFGTDAGTVRAVDAETGELSWELKLPSPGIKGIWSNLAQHEGQLYFGSYNGNLYCIAADDGRIVWKVLVSEWVGSSPVLLPEQDLLVIGLELARPEARGSVAAFRMTNGEKVWEHPLTRMQHGSCAYVRSRHMVVTGSADHEVLALDAASGAPIWRSPMRRSAKYAPAIDEGRGITVVAGFDGSIYVLRLGDGQKLAEFPTGDILYTTPLITHGRIFCGSGDGNVYVIDLDRLAIVQTLRLQARVFATPRLVDGSVMIATCGGMVVEIDPDSLKVLGRVTVPDAVTNAVAATPDGARVFVLTYMNELYAYDRIRAEDLRGGRTVTVSRPG